MVNIPMIYDGFQKKTSKRWFSRRISGCESTVGDVYVIFSNKPFGGVFPSACHGCLVIMVSHQLDDDAGGRKKQQLKKLVNRDSLGLSPLPGFQSPPGLWIVFRIGDPNLNLHLPLLLGGGTTQGIPYQPCTRWWQLKSLLFSTLLSGI